MSREILFKAKRLDNGEWAEGDLINNYDGRKFVGEVVVNDYIGKACDDYELGIGFYEVDPSTICQYTGLIDKNGKKIWENDIIKCGRNTLVTWDEHFASWCLTRKGWMYKHFFGESQEPEECEIIGNIFDNLDFLEE